MRFMFSLAVAAGAVILFLGCGSTEEVTTPTPVPTAPAGTAPATPSPAPTEVPTLAPSATPAPTDTPVPTTPSGSGGGGGEIGPGTVITPRPKPSPEPIPISWGTLTSGDHTIRHPDDWFSKTSQVSSWIPGEDDVSAAPFRADGIRIDFASKSQPIPSPKEASAFSVDGLVGWEVVRSYDPSMAGGIAQVHEMYVEGDGFAATFVGYFGPDAIDENLFWQIVSTFQPTP